MKYVCCFLHVLFTVPEQFLTCVWFGELQTENLWVMSLNVQDLLHAVQIMNPTAHVRQTSDKCHANVRQTHAALHWLSSYSDVVYVPPPGHPPLPPPSPENPHAVSRGQVLSIRTDSQGPNAQPALVCLLPLWARCPPPLCVAPGNSDALRVQETRYVVVHINELLQVLGVRGQKSEVRSTGVVQVCVWSKGPSVLVYMAQDVPAEDMSLNVPQSDGVVWGAGQEGAGGETHLTSSSSSSPLWVHLQETQQEVLLKLLRLSHFTTLRKQERPQSFLYLKTSLLRC